VLYLAFKVGERLFLADNVILEFRRDGRGSARVLVEAPKSVRIIRESLLSPEEIKEYERKAREGRE
jgi:sRNA-binding carbon storage regulator CsrA